MTCAGLRATPTISRGYGAEIKVVVPDEQHEMYFGEVAERSIAAGCKPAAFGLRRFEPSPPHQPFTARAREWRRSKVGGRCLFGRQAARRAAPRCEWSGALRAGKAAGLPRRSDERATSASREGGSNSVVESQPSKLLVAGSIPVSRSSLRSRLDRDASFGWQASDYAVRAAVRRDCRPKRGRS